MGSVAVFSPILSCFSLLVYLNGFVFTVDTSLFILVVYFDYQNIYSVYLFGVHVNILLLLLLYNVVFDTIFTLQDTNKQCPDTLCFLFVPGAYLLSFGQNSPCGSDIALGDSS